MGRESRILLVLTSLIVWFTGSGLSADIGSQAKDFSLTDARSGKSISLDEFKEAKAIAVIFISTKCPYSNAFNQVMNDLTLKYNEKKVVFLGINSNSTEPIEEVSSHAEKHSFTFPVLKDQGYEIADRFGAQVTPEVYLLDEQRMVRYHGALGNSKQPTTRAAKANSVELEQALDALLEGREIPVKRTKMFGCSIKR